MKIGPRIVNALSGATIMVAMTVFAEPAEVELTSWPFPQERQYGAHRAIIHAPQIQSWTDFKTFEALLAIEFFPAGENPPLLATARISGSTELQYELFRWRLFLRTQGLVQNF